MTIPTVTGFFDETTYTVTYVVADPDSGDCAIIDPVLDYNAASGRTTTDSIDKIIGFVKANQLRPVFVLETHVHADHLTGAPALASKFSCPIGIGGRIGDVQKVFAGIFNTYELATDGSQFDVLLEDGDTFKLGTMEGAVMSTPGHTPACSTYVIGDAAFVGDTLLMPDYGTARCDFPGGDAGVLFDSMEKILALPESTRLFLCHDYKAPGRDEFRWESSVREQKTENIHLKNGVSRDEFIAFRNKRDSGLGMPALIIPSIQVNMRAGELPEPEDNGTTYLKVPVDVL